MAKKKKQLFSTNEQYKHAAQSLRELVDFKIDFRKKLTPQTKSKITRAYKKYKPDSVHAQRYKQIKQHVTFVPDFGNLKRKDHKKIKHYYDSLRQIGFRKNIVYRSKDPEKLKEAMRYAGTIDSLPELNAAFIPYDTPSRPRIRFNKKGELRLISTFVNQSIILFDQEKLLEDTEGYLKNLLRPFPKETQFQVMNGLHFIPGARTKKFVIEYIQELMLEYKEDQKDWLFGVKVLEFKNQASVDELKAAMPKKKAKKRGKVKKIKIK